MSGAGPRTAMPVPAAGRPPGRAKAVAGAVLVLIGIAVLVGLGTWQMQRLAWKTALIDRIETRMAAAPVPLPARPDDPQDWDYRPVLLTGRFDHAHELYLGPRVRAGQPGLHVLTPFVRADGQGTVLVNRGWVPADGRDPAGRADGLPAGTVTLAGVARVPPPRGWMQPENRPEENYWFWIDLPAMEAATGAGGLAPLVVEAAAGPDAGVLPVGGQTVVTLRNNHLSYAVTWYGLAVTLAAMYAGSLLRRRRPTPA
ncbi:SURF1 family protein [Rhodospirillum centenum]|uniref:SURF1-like protein n=1 Tax=Rhodospirillum centenum (strain ATCC 51521 / SW) TaxID=414684 RepID=B6IXG2_RHOCS|nr:SURF1 family protein [Rhodospirillum centenum]ACJ00986.1 SURF1 family protein [Rhodospirillum centenum SW]